MSFLVAGKPEYVPTTRLDHHHAAKAANTDTTIPKKFEDHFNGIFKNLKAKEPKFSLNLLGNDVKYSYDFSIFYTVANTKTDFKIQYEWLIDATPEQLLEILSHSPGPRRPRDDANKKSKCFSYMMAYVLYYVATKEELNQAVEFLHPDQDFPPTKEGESFWQKKANTFHWKN